MTIKSQISAGSARYGAASGTAGRGGDAIAVLSPPHGRCVPIVDAPEILTKPLERLRHLWSSRNSGSAPFLFTGGAGRNPLRDKAAFMAM